MMMILLAKLVHLGFAYVTRCVLSLDGSVDWPQEIRSLQCHAYVGPEHSLRVSLLGQDF